jgi:hypothetical protein
MEKRRGTRRRRTRRRRRRKGHHQLRVAGERGRKEREKGLTKVAEKIPAMDPGPLVPMEMLGSDDDDPGRGGPVRVETAEKDNEERKPKVESHVTRQRKEREESWFSGER